ncbi:hypothetical protein OOZ63_00045 [Paucibacter sp. PLA-PC-4]|uniref:hypothetical protein n=1 Tax=Paucibacter sp. PLA-PC-4 TaxID=2993655 RepID=UPI002248B48D|nr:hypothetical protein [Paucibacter sp. PLA-PC-4]MCX2860227.1 hypothetical protein [Paucibacter sp. PLA-PC-4]
MSGAKQGRYLLELGAAMGAYALVLAGSIAWLQGVNPPQGLGRDALALSPMLPGLAVVWVILRQLRRMDELQRRVQLEALGLAFAGTALLTLGYGFLEGVGYPRMSSFVVWPVMASLWVVGLVLAARRYR